MSRRLAAGPLFRWFCGLAELAAVRVPGKSTLQEYAHWLPAETMRPRLEQRLLAAQQPAGAAALELAHGRELETVWRDTTGLKTNLHFPVAGVLLGAAVRTRMKATRLIRTHGRKQRLAPPEDFLQAMNRLSRQLTVARRAKDSHPQRQKILRLMKQPLTVVTGPARRQRELLAKEWPPTDWTRRHAVVPGERAGGRAAIGPEAGAEGDGLWGRRDSGGGHGSGL